MSAFSIPKFEHQHVPLWKVAAAQRLMKLGWDPEAVAIHVGVRFRDLDLAIWDALKRYEDRWE